MRKAEAEEFFTCTSGEPSITKSQPLKTNRLCPAPCLQSALSSQSGSFVSMSPPVCHVALSAGVSFSVPAPAAADAIQSVSVSLLFLHVSLGRHYSSDPTQSAPAVGGSTRPGSHESQSLLTRQTSTTVLLPQTLKAPPLHKQTRSLTRFDLPSLAARRGEGSV